MFTLYQKRHFIPPNKVNSPPSCQFYLFSICHETIIKREGTRRPQYLLWVKNSSLSLFPSKRYFQSIICSDHTFHPGHKPFSAGYLLTLTP